MKGGGKSNGNDDEREDVVKVALHPFDNEPIWQGNSTIIDELAEQLPAVAGDSASYRNKHIPMDAIICSVGGGGLLNGLIMGLERFKPIASTTTTTTTTSDKVSPIHLVAIETYGTDSLSHAMSSQSHVSIPKITSQATSLGATRVSQKTFQYAVSPPHGLAVHSAVLSDADAARGVLRLVDDERILVELACGVCVEAAVGDAGKARSTTTTSSSSPVSLKKRKRNSGLARDEGYGDDRSSVENESDLDDRRHSITSSDPSGDAGLQSKLKQMVSDLNSESRVVIVVCGGSNISLDTAMEYKRMLADGWQ